MKTETRARLVEAARTLFWEQGYANTGIAQILKAADALSGSLYYFFPTKEDLLVAVLEEYKGLLMPMVVQPVFERVTDPIERIFGILDGYRKGLLAMDFRYGCPIGNLALEVSNELPVARELLAENFTGWCKVVETCLEEAAGRLPADLDKARLAQFVLNTMEGAVMLARTYRTIEPYDTAVSQLRDYIDRLLKDGSDWSAPRRPKRRKVKPRRSK
ncbi:MAG TPA: TetR family transcriptional regulator C-terminal domain-containing protein [Gemmataceae bacterium]|jgi:AcrR family transcriptional regulator|nr:TetR family transcriptional regulator C-terminal domain-containing protein [Gemmataceae bacterium]